MSKSPQPKFEVTQILATRLDSNDQGWFLVQWGCSWIPCDHMLDSTMLRDYLAKPKLSQSGLRVHVPVESGTQTAVDAENCRKRNKTQHQAQHHHR